MAALKDLSIKAKLLSGLGFICVAVLVLGFIINLMNSSTIEEIKSTRTNVLPHMMNYLEIRRDIEQIQGWLTDISATRGEKGYDDGFNEAEKFYQDAVVRIDTALSKHKKYNENEAVLFLEKMKVSLKEYYDMGKKMAHVYIDDGPSKGNIMMAKFDPFAAKLSSMIEKCVNKYVQVMETSFDGIHGNSKSNSRTMLFMVAAVIILSLIFAFLVVFPISSALKASVIRFKDVADEDADLTKRLNIVHRDEIGHIAKWFNIFVERIHNIIVEISSNASTVTASSNELIMVSGQMADSSEELFSKAVTVAGAAEEMSSNMNSVAAAIEEASTNIGSVADSASQMQATLGEVAGSCENAKIISDKAKISADEATQRVELLGNAAKEISKVTEVITKIASQTDLLALNATIEAARAGEAGKGFAVVAEEIKHLAGQTASATGDIRDKISGIQNSTNDTVKDVTKISEIILDVNEIVTTIAAAVEEQSASATEVAQNIEQASIGISEVNQNVAESSQVTAEIAKDMSGVNEVAEELSKQGTQMSTNAKDLSDLSVKSSNIIRLFKVSTENKHDRSSDRVEREVPDLMPWGKKLILGIDEIDSQHKELVSLINQLHRAMKLEKGLQVSGNILKGLADYTIFHFDHEKKIFEKYEYSEKDQHLKIHDDLVNKVLDFKKQFENGNAAITMDLMDFLNDWLRSHILKTDKKYVPFLKEKMQNV